MSLSAKEVLQKYWGYESFREPQAEIIQNIYRKRDTFALLPTGGGKSICFQVPILMQEGLCLVISPLVALMKDQVKQLEQRGIRAALLSSEILYSDQQRILDNCRYGKVKLLYVSPERMQSEEFIERLTYLPVKFFAIDEAHCISEWGHDFRPSYLALKNLKELFPDLPILAVTATATPRTVKDITKQLQLKDVRLFQTSLNRENLAYRVEKTQDKISELIFNLRQNKGSAIVFANSRKQTYELSNLLKIKGFDVDYFHARLSTEEKNAKQKAFIESDNKILVSTNAFGMGIDKPNIRRVYHMNAPKTIESYFQEVGRGGRDGEPAAGILFYNEEDKKKDIKLFKSSTAKKDEFLDIIKKLYNYFQVADHEFPTGQKGFSEKKFRTVYHLHKQKVRHVLQFLKTKEVIEIHGNQRQSLVKIQIKNTALPEGKNNEVQILEYLARKYGGIFNEPAPIDEYKIGLKLGLEKHEVKEALNILSEKNYIYYRDAAIVKIEFLEPRDDNEAVVYWWKDFKQHQLQRWKRLNDIYFFIENDTICKNKLLLNYFGEKEVAKCGRCSVCKPKLYSTDLEINDLYNYISQDVRQDYEILEAFNNFDRNEIFKCLQQLIDEEKIKFVPPNFYSL